MTKGYSPISTQDSDDTYQDDSQIINNQYHSNEFSKIDFKKVIPETKNFDQFITIDKIAEKNSPILTGSVRLNKRSSYLTRNDFNAFESNHIYNQNNDYHKRDQLTSKFEKYKIIIWNKCKTFITLTTVAVVIGCFAGFIQIFTETLVNWKTGYCSRNFLLNKSFCCSNIQTLKETVTNRSFFNSLTKRQEIECTDQGEWIEWSGAISPFLIFVILSVTFATISTLLVKYVAPMATGSGISEIKVWVSGFEYKNEFLSMATLFVKSVALPLAISAGLSLGKEGPSVHYATCCAFIVTRWLLKDTLTYSSQFEYLIAGGGAGVAVAFGAPIGGVLFGLEELSSASDFNAQTLWKSYYVALIAVTTLKCINPFRNGKIILFNVTYDKNWRAGEIPIFILLGIFGGLYGKYVSKLNIAYVNFRKRYLSKWATQEIVILALITALLSYFNEFLKLDMTESMGVLFHECVSGDAKQDNGNNSVFSHKLCYLDEHTEMFGFLKMFFSLIYATFIRAALVIISYGAKVPAGIFVPSMAVGATFGRAISLLVERYITGAGIITSGAYAFLGAAATLCGITNLTLTVVVIMLELTGAFIYIIPTMIVVAISRIILPMSGTVGIADQMIIVNGFPLLEMEDEELKKGEALLSSYKARDVMSKDLIVLNETMYISEIEKIIYESNDKIVNGFPIVINNDTTDPDMECIGYVLRRHLVQKLMMQDINSSNASRILVHFNIERLNSRKNNTNNHMNVNINEISFCDIVNSSPLTAKLDTSTLVLFHMFKDNGCKSIIIEDHGLLKGIITSKDIIRFQRTLFKEKFGAKYHYNEELNEKIWSILQFIIKRFS